MSPVSSSASSVSGSGTWGSTVAKYEFAAAVVPTSRPSLSERYQRCSRISWKISAGASRPRRLSGMAASTTSYTSSSQRLAATVSETGWPSFCSRYPRKLAMSLSRRRAWFSSASIPVRTKSWRRWCPDSATRVRTRSRLPSPVLTSSTSSASKPSSLRRRSRSAMRYRCSSGRRISSLVSSCHSRSYRVRSSSATSNGSISGGSRSPACRSSSSPPTRSQASSRSQLRWPSVSEGCCSLVSESTRYASSAPASKRNSVLDREQSPQKKPDRKLNHRVEQPVGRLATPGVGEQRPVGGGVVEEPGDQDRVSAKAAVNDDPHHLDGRDAGVRQAAQQPVFAPGESFVDGFQRVELAVLLGEADDVPRDPAHPDLHQPVVPPVLERLGPGQGEESCCLVGRRTKDKAHESVRLLGQLLSPARRIAGALPGPAPISSALN